MKRFSKLVLIILALPVLGMAQAPPSFTLEECIDYALDNSISVKNAVVDEKIADARVKETRGIGLPQIDGSVSLQHNTKLPPFFARYATAQSFAGKDENGNNILDIPGAQPTDVVASANFFQLPSNGNASVSVNQILFNGSYLVGLKAANAYRELSIRSTRQTKEQTIQQVTKAYYGVLINKDRMQLFDNNIARVDSLLKTTKALNENGFAEGIDVDRIQVTLNNLIAERDKFYNLQELAVHLLKFQMNYPMDQPLDVRGDIASRVDIAEL